MELDDGDVGEDDEEGVWNEKLKPYWRDRRMQVGVDPPNR